MHIGRIVVGVSLTGASMQAAEWAARAFAPEAQVVLLHCLSPQYGEHRETDERQLAEATMVVLQRRIGLQRCGFRIRRGDPARRLAELAAEVDADLIAVGVHEETANREPKVGSTAERLIRCSAVPVLLCAETLTGAPRSILLPLECGDVPRSVADWTNELAGRFGARLALVHIEPIHRERLTGRRVPDRLIERSTRPWTHVADGLPGDRVIVDAVLGEPADVVLNEAHRFGTELVLLEAPTDEFGSDFPSTVDRVLRRSECAVLIVPPLEGPPT
jgi:nucleotide-binding universal stress UspA family protein